MVFVGKKKKEEGMFCRVLTCSGAAVLMSVITPRKRVLFFYSQDTLCTETSAKQKPPNLKTEGGKTFTSGQHKPNLLNINTCKYTCPYQSFRF